MLPVKAWRIHYADGSTFDSTQGTWSEAPAFGVTCVVWYHVDQLSTIDAGRDVYTYQGDAAGDHYKMGLWQDDDGFHRVMDLARREVAP